LRGFRGFRRLRGFRGPLPFALCVADIIAF